MGARSLAFAALLLAACAGPRPTLSEVRVAPSPLAGRYRVEATVTNRSRGQGQVEVQIELRDPKSGRRLATERDVDLHAHEQVHLVADIEAPPAAWVPHLQAEYPPR